jgi:hypothetical protein
VFIVRLGGMPFSAAEALATDDVRSKLRAYLTSDAVASQSAAAASDVLHSFVGIEQDSGRRAGLLRLRRDLFNRRVPRPADTATVATTQTDLEIPAAIEALRVHLAAEASLTEAFEDALPVIRNRIRSVMDASRMRDGVLLSSPTLYRNFRRYFASSQRRLSARDLQIERGVLRYLTRAATKATPFAAFCTVVPGNMIDGTGSNQPFQLVGNLEPRRSEVRLNKLLYDSLWEHAKQRSATRDVLLVELNSTVEERAGEVVFLAGFRAREVFQRIESNAAVSLVVAAVRNGGFCTFRSLVEALAADAQVDASVEEARKFLDVLVSIGMIRFRGAAQAQEADWAPPLIELLEDVDDDHAREIVLLLRGADNIARRYGQSDTSERERLEVELRQAIAGTMKRLGVKGGRELGLPLYEDCGADVQATLLRSATVEGAIDAMREYVERLLPIAYPRPEMATMRHFFECRYPGSDGVPLLTFYEDYYREHFRGHLEKVQRATRGESSDELRNYNIRNPFRLTVVDQFFDAYESWARTIRDRWAAAPDAEEINVSSREIPIQHGVPPLNPSVPRSVVLFCQFVPAVGASPARFVTNAGQAYLGFGKYFSRFLHIMPARVTEAIVEHNAGLTSTMLAEIGGDANFNGNLHPRLLPWQITYPTGDGEDGNGALISADLVVMTDPEDTVGLMLQHRVTGRRVQPLDLGFLSPTQRPPLYQLLMRFSPFGGQNVRLPQSPVAGPAQFLRPTDIVYRPRIVYEDSIVLSRRTWSIPSSKFPGRSSGESDSRYFARLNVWRHKLGVPEQVYVRVTPHAPRSTSTAPHAAAQQVVKQDGDVGQQGADAAGHADAASPNRTPNGINSVPLQRPSRDYAKPQYIDFASPVLVDLFSRLPATLSEYTMHLEERYPGPEALPVSNGERFAAELVVQLDWRGT